MAEDLRLLLAYEGTVPRGVLASYIKTILGLHLGLFMLRLVRLLPDRVQRAQRREEVLGCPLETGSGNAYCPHAFEMIVDLTDNPNSASAALAKSSVAQHMEGVPAYVRAVILVNRLKEFAGIMAASGKIPSASSVDDLLRLLSDPPPDMDGFFTARIADIMNLGPEEEADPVEQGILRMEGLSPLEKYVELVSLQRMKIERARVVDLIDSLAQKKKPGGFMQQPAGARSARRFALHSNLLEALVQIAVLTKTELGQIEARPVLIDDFIEWLRTRYGFVIYAPASRSAPPEQQDAWRSNEQALRDRLHQIGFFVDLSDAYNSQTLRPRYSVNTHA